MGFVDGGCRGVDPVGGVEDASFGVGVPAREDGVAGFGIYVNVASGTHVMDVVGAGVDAEIGMGGGERGGPDGGEGGEYGDQHADIHDFQVRSTFSDTGERRCVIVVEVIAKEQKRGREQGLRSEQTGMFGMSHIFRPRMECEMECDIGQDVSALSSV